MPDSRPGKRSAEEPLPGHQDKKQRGTRDNPIDLTRDEGVTPSIVIKSKEDFAKIATAALKERLTPASNHQPGRHAFVDSALLEDAVRSYFSEK